MRKLDQWDLKRVLLRVSGKVLSHFSGRISAENPLSLSLKVITCRCELWHCCTHLVTPEDETYTKKRVEPREQKRNKTTTIRLSRLEPFPSVDFQSREPIWAWYPRRLTHMAENPCWVSAGARLGLLTGMDTCGLSSTTVSGWLNFLRGAWLIREQGPKKSMGKWHGLFWASFSSHSSQILLIINEA